MISRIIDVVNSAPLVRRAGRASASSALGAWSLTRAADRRGAGHHQQAGADQHHRPGAVAGRDRKAGHLPHRDRAGRHARPRIHALAFAQRIFAGDGGVQRARPTSISRASRSTSACSKSASSLPPGAEPRMGPVSTGLGEIYMWTVELSRRRRGAVKDGQPGWQGDGAYLTPDGQRLTSEVERAAYLRTVQDWIIRPQIKRRARRGRRGCDRRIRQAIPGAARPDRS